MKNWWVASLEDRLEAQCDAQLNQSCGEERISHLMVNKYAVTAMDTKSCLLGALHQWNLFRFSCKSYLMFCYFLNSPEPGITRQCQCYYCVACVSGKCSLGAPLWRWKSTGKIWTSSPDCSHHKVRLEVLLQITKIEERLKNIFTELFMMRLSSKCTQTWSFSLLPSLCCLASSMQCPNVWLTLLIGK